MSEPPAGPLQPPGDRPAAEPFCLVIFGASGDLTRRKLLPALFNLFRQDLLGEHFVVLGVARRPWDDDAFRNLMREAVQSTPEAQPFDLAAWDQFVRRLHYHQAHLDDPAAYPALRQRLDGLAAPAQPPLNYLFYLATQPAHFAPVVQGLHAADLHRRGRTSPWARLVVEKPFGRDFQSARDLNNRLDAVFDESQIFRIDHFLGKETVQNLLVLRFANAIFEPLWNHRYIDHVQIAVTETLGVGGRGPYYEQAGAIRDILQNHMMHLLSLVALEPPASLHADAVRDEKVKVIRALRPLPAECVGATVVRAQYAPGVMAGQPVLGYTQEPGVAPDSRTETFAALRVFIDNWRWAGVPFYLRTGKRLPVRISEIDVHFKPVPRVLFNADPARPLSPNWLAIRIQPHEGITLQFQVKTPGLTSRIHPFKMDFGYAEAFGRGPAEAYERLLLDALRGDSTLFARSDEVEAAWNFLDPILEGCRACFGPLPQYPAGVWGPVEADQLIQADGRRWQLIKRTPAAPRHRRSPTDGPPETDS